MMTDNSAITEQDSNDFARLTPDHIQANWELTQDGRDEIYKKAKKLIHELHHTQPEAEPEAELAHVVENIYYDGYDGLGGETQINDLYVILRMAPNRYKYYMFTMSHICGTVYEDEFELVSDFEYDSMSMNYFEYTEL